MWPDGAVMLASCGAAAELCLQQSNTTARGKHSIAVKEHVTLHMTCDVRRCGVEISNCTL